MGKFGLIGKGLEYSYSVPIHQMFGNYTYELLETSEEELESRLRDHDYDGFNVTLPYKQKVIDYCDEISPEALATGSVNTIIREFGKLKGYNTDYFGFCYLLDRNEIDVTGKKCLILGSGGVSHTVRQVLKDRKAADIAIASRTGGLNYDNIYEKAKDAEIIINTTPVGMYPDNGRSLIDIREFPHCCGAVDVIYNPDKTWFILDAMSHDIPCAGGISMLVAEIKQASELFQQKEISDDDIDTAIYEIRSQKLNYILIGMPGAGKTYLGGQMAKARNRDFYDLDTCIEKNEGMSRRKIIKEKGEDYFRNKETECLRRLCKKNGIIIAAGSGIVTRKANYSLMKQNGRIIWIKRDLDKLEIDDYSPEPEELKKLYDERADLYDSWSDYFIDNNQEL
ncbi:MAG: hypothetical protein LKE44_00595 [Eubacterium sp.]|jgi:shikimate dehydrogenase|nr:hypothetical protein [Eubacterium sp.]